MSLIRSGGISTPPTVTAFGESLVAQETPIIQISSEYGLLNVLTAGLGGTTSITNSLFTSSTGVGAANVAAIVSAREANQRPGQGLSCKFSALFTAGQPDSFQEAGLISSESAFAFGYNDESFGILYGSDGGLETQELLITAGGGNETATITVDGNVHLVGITNSSINENAYEIAEALNLVEAGYRFTSNGGIVTALARLPDLGGGIFAFSSSSAAASWVEIKNGTIPIETWTPIENWSVKPNYSIDPTKLNDFKIQIQGNINFYVKNEVTGDFILVHVIEYINTETKPSISNPTFRIGWAARNRGNTSDIIVKGGYGASFVEGMVKYNQVPFGASNIQSGVGLAATNVISFRNRSVFKGVANRAEIIPLILSLGSDSTKPVIFEVVSNPETTGFLDWEYLDEANSLMEISMSDVPITGTVIAVFTMLGSIEPIDMQKILEFQIPTSYFSITARVTQGASSDMIVSGTWKEDL